MQHLKNHLLAYTLLAAILFIGVVSYERFLVNHDYIVEYEGECDAETESCFVGCEDDECTETYYYSLVEKYAADVRKQCGVDITDCEDANICLESDTHCSVTYCDAESEECSETTTQEDI